MYYTTGDYCSYTDWVSQSKMFGVDSPQTLSKAMVYSTGETPVCDSLAQLILLWESKAEGKWDFRHTSLISFFLGVVFVARCSAANAGLWVALQKQTPTTSKPGAATPGLTPCLRPFA